MTVVKQMKIVAIGDSITEGYPFSNQDSWVEHLAQALQCEVLNQGICGDFTGGMLKRFRRDALDHDPTHVIMLGGANDAYEKLTVEDVSLNFKAMVQGCRANRIIPILGLPTPSLLTVEEEHLVLYRNWLKGYVKANQIDMIDFYSPFLKLIKEGHAGHLYFDEVHPSLEGYACMGQIAVQSLKNL